MLYKTTPENIKHHKGIRFFKTNHKSQTIKVLQGNFQVLIIKAMSKLELFLSFPLFRVLAHDSFEKFSCRLLKTKSWIYYFQMIGKNNEPKWLHNK